MSVRNWNFFYKKEENSLKEKIVNTVSLWCAIGLLWWGFCDILSEHYLLCLRAFEITAEGTKQTGMDWWILIPWMVLLWGSYEWKSQKHKTFVTLVREVTILMPIGYGIWQYEKISQGFAAFLKTYISQVNTYYQLNLQVEDGVQEWMPVAFTFLSMILWLVCWLLAYGTKQKLLLLIFPLTALGMQLAVGLSPVGNGLLAVLVAGVLLLSLGGKSIMTKALALGMTVLTLIATPVVFVEQIQDFSTEGQKQAVLNWQESLLDFELSDLVAFLDFHFNQEHLRNEAPNFTGKEMLEIRADYFPQTPIYLRGFYGTEYKNQTWIWNKGDFSSAAKDMGMTEAEAGRELSYLPYEQIKSFYSRYQNIVTDLHYEIKYTGAKGNVAYVPYYTNVETLDDTYTFIGDYLLQKSVFQKEMEADALLWRSNDFSWEHVAQKIERGLHGTSRYWNSADILTISEERIAHMKWQNEQAQKYLEVPKDMETITAVAVSLKEEIIEAADWYLLSWHLGEEDMQFTTDNIYRFRAMEAVKNYLSCNMSYSLILDELPRGTDPIEYMLTESYEGYCMHFATAATLMLRELGVPARYVSGYVVYPGVFEWQENDAKAVVTDYAAHAWVEVYLDYIGWIPLEVTPGYEGGYDEYPTMQDKDQLESEAEEHRNEMNQSEPESESETESESPQTPSESETTDTSESQQPSETETEEKPFGGADGAAGSDYQWSSLLKWIGYIGCAMALIAAAVCLIRKRIRHFDQILEQEIRKNRSRKAIKRINRRLYMWITAKKVSVKVNIFRKRRYSDAEYEAALIRTFTKVSPEDWQKYMCIVKKAHYSKEDISLEEMQHCYQCYQFIRGCSSDEC